VPEIVSFVVVVVVGGTFRRMVVCYMTENNHLII